MHFTEIDMKIQTAVGCQNAVGFPEAWLQEGQIIIKVIPVPLFPQYLGFIALALKTHPVAILR